jgi:hypothetical protein
VVITQISDLELAIEQKGFEHFRISRKMSKLDIINNTTQKLKAISKDTKIPSEIHSFFSKKVRIFYK